MAASAAGSHRSVRTGRPDTAWNVIGVTNSRGAVGHDHLDLGTALAQAPHQVRALVGRDAAGDAEQDAFAVHALIIAPLPRAARVRAPQA